jgi:hypothetical protein
MSEAAYADHLKEVLRGGDDLKLLADIEASEPNWISPKQVPADA